MNRLLLLTMTIFVLTGCIDLGRVGMLPELKTAYFEGNPYTVTDCMNSAALEQHLSLNRDESSSDGTKRYNLQDANYEDVAWLEFNKFSHKQTSVLFYYAHHSPDVAKAITAMISQCKKENV